MPGEVETYALKFTVQFVSKGPFLRRYQPQFRGIALPTCATKQIHLAAGALFRNRVCIARHGFHV